jgi:lipopolysaccharide/colanic/teichoic acid biosynthesis glycosyltransferase
MYIENYSLMLDIKLILMTIRIMLKKDSTEGFDKAEELEAMKNRILTEMKDDAMVGSGK